MRQSGSMAMWPPAARPASDTEKRIGSSAGPVADHRNSTGDAPVSPGFSVDVDGLGLVGSGVAQPACGVTFWPADRLTARDAVANRAAMRTSLSAVFTVRNLLAPVRGDAAMTARARARGSAATGAPSR